MARAALPAALGLCVLGHSRCTGTSCRPGSTLVSCLEPPAVLSSPQVPEPGGMGGLTQAGLTPARGHRPCSAAQSWSCPPLLTGRGPRWERRTIFSGEHVLVSHQLLYGAHDEVDVLGGSALDLLPPLVIPVVLSVGTEKLVTMSPSRTQPPWLGESGACSSQEVAPGGQPPVVDVWQVPRLLLPEPPGKRPWDPRLRVTSALLVPIPTSMKESRRVPSHSSRFLLLKKHVFYANLKGVNGMFSPAATQFSRLLREGLLDAVGQASTLGSTPASIQY